MPRPSCWSRALRPMSDFRVSNHTIISKTPGDPAAAELEELDPVQSIGQPGLPELTPLVRDDHHGVALLGNRPDFWRFGPREWRSSGPLPRRPPTDRANGRGTGRSVGR